MTTADKLLRDATNAIADLRSVLCDPEGNASINGSVGDLAIIEGSLQRIEAYLATPRSATPMQLPPLTDIMYHAVRGSEYHFTSGGESMVVGYLNDDCLDEIWDNINTALRVAGVPVLIVEGVGE